MDPTWSLHKVLYTLYLVTTPLVLQLFLFNLKTLQQILTVSHCKVQYFDLRNITPWSNRDHTWCNTKIFNILKSCYPTLILFRASVALNKCSVCAFVLSSQLIMDITKVLLNFGVFYNILSCSRQRCTQWRLSPKTRRDNLGKCGKAESSDKFVLARSVLHICGVGVVGVGGYCEGGLSAL